MKSKMTVLAVFTVLSMLLLILPGCYTQLGSLRDDRVSENADNNDQEEEYSQNSSGSYANQTTAGGGYYDDYYYNPNRVGFSYYYPSNYWPSTAFTVSYNHLWCYDPYYSYDPWLCGTPYVTYPWYGYNNYYPSYYSGYYWSSYLPPAYYNYGYGYPYTPARRTTRDFGPTRGSTTNTEIFNPGSGRDYSNPPSSGGFERVSGGVSAGSSGSQEVKRTARPGTSQRGYTEGTDNTKSTGRTDRGVRGVSTRDRRSRSDGNRGSQAESPQYNPNPGNSAPPASYTPPARGNSQPTREASPARESAPRQSGSSGRQPESNARGGSSRGRP